MGLNDLQSHITQNVVNALSSVDLLKIAQAAKNNKNKSDRGEAFKLIVDGECCLDRLYGGYFPDWVCGGQWNKMHQFLSNFRTVVQNSNLDIVICFNGALEPERLETEWKQKQEETFKFIEEIHRHVTYKKKPPPKLWWIAPAYLHSAVRLTFRSLQIRTMSTLEDHHKEIVRFCRNNSFHGVVADDSEYLVFDIPRYFSAQKLKLTFKGSLETVEMKLMKVYEDLNLPKEKFHIFAALLGNHLLSETDLTCLYSALGIDSSSKTSAIEKVGEFTRTLEPNTDIDKVVEKISQLISESDETDEGSAEKSNKDNKEQLLDKVAKCLKYYSDLNIPKPAFQKEKKNKGNKTSKKGEQQQKVQKSPAVPSTTTTTTTPTPVTVPLDDIDTTTTLSETSETSKSNDDKNENNMIDGALPSDTEKLEGDSSKIFDDTENTDPETLLPTPSTTVVTNGITETTTASSSSDPNAKTSLDKLLYRVNPEIENVCITRHKNGLMSPYIYHILKHKEIKLNVIIQESKESKDLPRAHELFRPLRQRVYAILFNLHHLHFLAKQRNEKAPAVYVKETYYCPQSKGIKSDLVQAIEIGWGVPTVERLWLGDKEECKRKRTRAFLGIMKSDKPIILDSTFVPQQMLVLACVLRYILSTERKVLRKSELEAFIAQAFIQEMTDPSIAQDIEVGNLTMRGVHLAHLFMEGVDEAVLANDACGAPIPYVLFSPWMFFNGKVFSYVMEQQNQGKSMAEICGFKLDLVFSIDQLRLAVTEGVKVQYAQASNSVPFLFGHNNGPLLNHMLAPANTRVPSYIQPNHMTSHSQAFGGGGPGSLSHLAAAAAAATNNRNRMLGGGHGLQSQNPFVVAASGGGGGGGIYGNYNGSVVSGGGLQHHHHHHQSSRGVPIYPHEIPGRQGGRRGVSTTRGSGGQLEVAGMVVGSWGANYGANVGLSGGGNHHLMSGGRNARIPMGAAYVNPNIQMNSLFDQMRISGGNRLQNFRQNSAQNTSWQQNKRNMIGKNQKKTVVGKKTDNANNKPANNGKTASETKSNNVKGTVSFKEEPQRLENESGAGVGDDEAAEASNKDNAVFKLEETNMESSLSQVNHNHEG